MTPAYAADGQVCMMRLYPKLISSDSNYLDAKLEIDEVLEIINQLVPVGTRGARKGFFGISDLGGGVVWTHFNYARVAFTFISTFKLDKLPDPEPGSEQGIDLSSVDEASLAEAKHREAMRSDDELIRERTVATKVVEVRCIDRKCVGK
jgi:hypothetical protein